MLKNVFEVIDFLEICSIRWIVEIVKKLKLKCWCFINNNHILVKLFQKKPKQQYYFLWKIPEITILFWVLDFSFMYLVSVYLTNRTIISNFRCLNKGSWLHHLKIPPAVGIPDQNMFYLTNVKNEWSWM